MNTGVGRTFSLLLLLSISFDPSACYYNPKFDSSWEDYDYSILDPLSANGDPYGGYSRATRSRLASIPLFLPDAIHDEREDDDIREGDGNSQGTVNGEQLYVEVADADGNPYVCRVYYEDELDPESLSDSMFDFPRFRDASSVPTNKETKVERQLGSMPEFQHSPLPVKNTPEEHGEVLISTEEMDSLLESKISIKAHLKIAGLNGLCGQIHKGWWSYEWCFEREVRQFHVQIDKHGAQLRIESPSILGQYQSREVMVDLRHVPPNSFLRGKKEYARVVDHHTNGELCDETGKNREAFVHFQCCSDTILERSRGLLHRSGQQILSNDAAVISIEEGPVCTYNLTVCTPFLCDDNYDSNRKDSFQPEREQPQVAPLLRSNRDAPAKILGGVRDILDASLGGKCLQTETGGWWNYEFCHSGSIRQYHETIGTRKSSAGVVIMSKTLETEHLLGQYDPAEATKYPGEDWRFVVNATKDDPQKSLLYGGNGAYFEVEYPDGDVCDNADVTDAAIVAGTSAGGSGSIARSSSVRYSCGPSYGITVNEDATCHYVVHVAVPDLCRHALFKAPVAKKQVVKCLPA